MTKSSVLKTLLDAPKHLSLFLLKVYSYCISPFLGNNCRFYPSCSQYMQEAIIRYGVIKGGYLGIKRLLRCHPWNQGGLDPVPDSKNSTEFHH